MHVVVLIFLHTRGKSNHENHISKDLYLQQKLLLLEQLFLLKFTSSKILNIYTPLLIMERSPE